MPRASLCLQHSQNQASMPAAHVQARLALRCLQSPYKLPVACNPLSAELLAQYAHPTQALEHRPCVMQGEQLVKEGPKPLKVIFTELAVGLENDYHCCPQVQLVITLKGSWCTA